MILAYLLALGSAVTYGAADFLGGMAARRSSTIPTVVISQFAGFVMLVILLPVLPDASPARADLLWGAVAGLTGGTGVALLYRALAIGTMAIVAPITAVCAVAVPVVAAVFLGERPAPLTALGILLAMVAIALVSQQKESSQADDGRAESSRAATAVPLALTSGVAIGLFFLALARTTAGAGLWPLLVARVVSVALFGLVAIGSGRSLRIAPPVLRIAIAGGVLDMLANALYVTATRYAPLSVVVTLSSLYPASTVMLARFVLGERLSSWQTAGVACALAAVMLIVGATQ